MSYRHYETECFVVSLSGERGANRSVFLLSRELGPIRAHAQGLRLEKSKLRYSLQAPARARVVLVKGRDIWRIVGAENAENFWLNLRENREQLILIERIFYFLEKILIGDETNHNFFSIVEGLVDFVLKEREARSEDLLSAELITVARLLHSLGYFNYAPAEEILKRTQIDPLDIDLANKDRKSLLLAVNKALKESHF